LENAPYLDMGQPYAAGSLYSTVEDLAVWDEALYSEKLVKRATLDRIFKPWIEAGGMGSYGYGWGISTVKGHKNIAHGGGINGFNSYISRFPEDHAMFAWLRNVSARGGPSNDDLTRILFGEKVDPPKEKVAVKVDPKVFDAVLGTFELRPGFALTFTRDGDHLFAQANSQPKNEIFPLSETRYFLRGADAEIEFLKNDKGEVDRLILHQGGADVQGKKVR
jgi:CubicO group peptidase (beta-lactamase class C family)